MPKEKIEIDITPYSKEYIECAADMFEKTSHYIIGIFDGLAISGLQKEMSSHLKGAIERDLTMAFNALLNFQKLNQAIIDIKKEIPKDDV